MTLRERMWRHALDATSTDASHSRIVSSACDFLADRLEAVLKGGDASNDSRRSEQSSPNHSDVTPPPVGQARGACKHCGHPDGKAHAKAHLFHCGPDCLCAAVDEAKSEPLSKTEEFGDGWRMHSASDGWKGTGSRRQP